MGQGLKLPGHVVKTQVSRLWAVVLSLSMSDRKAGFLHQAGCGGPALCPGPHALCLRLCPRRVWGQTHAFVLGSRLSMQVPVPVRGLLPAPPPARTHPPAGWELSVTLSSELFTAHITAGPARLRTRPAAPRQLLHAVFSQAGETSLLGSG